MANLRNLRGAPKPARKLHRKWLLSLGPGLENRESCSQTKRIEGWTAGRDKGWQLGQPRNSMAHSKSDVTQVKDLHMPC